jgi:hypothetical protein
MSSDAQKRAARENGAKSRGPKTPEGKRRSSRNSLRHGLLAKSLLTDLEDFNSFADLHARITAAFQPEDDVARMFVENMVAARWRSHRLYNIESAGLQKETHAQIDAGHIDLEKDPSLTPRDCLAQAFNALATHSTPAVLHIDRYESRYDRQFSRNVAMLMKWRDQKRKAQKESKSK